MLMDAHALAVKVDADQRIMSMVCVFVFTEHECVSLSLEMEVRAFRNSKLSVACVLRYTHQNIYSLDSSSNLLCQMNKLE